MSESTEEIQESPETNDMLGAFQQFLATLDPPNSVEIRDIFGNKYELNCSVSARKQIRILREFDSLKETKSVELPSGNKSIIKIIADLASNESVLLTICRCFNLAHPNAALEAKKSADSQNYEYEDGDFACADLFALEELAAAIVPLFIRLAKRTSQALTKVL